MYKLIVLFALFTAVCAFKPDQHWCCNTGAAKPMPVILKKTVVHYGQGTVALKTGYDSCGTWGTSRCSKYSARYQQTTMYGVEYQRSADFDKCTDFVCCDGHVKVAGHCFTIEDFNKNADNILLLKTLDLIDETGSKNVGK